MEEYGRVWERVREWEGNERVIYGGRGREGSERVVERGRV